MDSTREEQISEGTSQESWRESRSKYRQKMGVAYKNRGMIFQGSGEEILLGQ